MLFQRVVNIKVMDETFSFSFVLLLNSHVHFTLSYISLWTSHIPSAQLPQGVAVPILVTVVLELHSKYGLDQQHRHHHLGAW